MKKLIAISLVSLLFGTSCKKDLVEKFEATQANTKTVAATQTANLIVDNKFDWKTSQEVKLNLRGYANSAVLISTESGKILEKSMLKTNESYSTTVIVPLTEKSIVLHYMGQKVSIDLNKESINYQFN